MMNYGSVVTKEAIARTQKAPARKGPSLLGVLAAQPHTTRDARSRFNDRRTSKAAPSATQQSARPIVVQRSPVPAARSPSPAAAPAPGGLTEEQRLTIERNKAAALARRQNRLGGAPQPQQPRPTAIQAAPKQPQPAGPRPGSKPAGATARGGLFFNRNRGGAVKPTATGEASSTGARRHETAATNASTTAKPWHLFKQIM
jgi:hypothetical protein